MCENNLKNVPCETFIANIDIYITMDNPTEQKRIRHGYLSELAKLCNCNRKTVSRALFEGYRGPKSDEVLRVYNKIYNTIDEKK